MDQKTCEKAYVASSNGAITIHAMTGVVMAVELFEDCALPDILHFDLDEYYRTYPNESREEIRNYDILDLGYTYVSEAGVSCYEEPAHEWRKEYAKSLAPHSDDPELIPFRL